ncbi:DUF2871 family protein, partial [Staphylococcus hominis]|uniref:DUF2871 family protein n=1 Tax=Staphylococcus hominis TaxID=1290 RepID=UPI0011A20C06
MPTLLYPFLLYIIIPLLTPFYYTQLTKPHHFTPHTQLPLLHTHTLILPIFIF